MNCWFCNNHINIPDDHQYYHDLRCVNDNCYKYGVIYKCISKELLDVVQFHATINKRFYFVNYWVYTQEICITKQNLNKPKFPPSYDVVMKIPYTQLTLTPGNVDNKLPILLLLS